MRRGASGGRVSDPPLLMSPKRLLSVPPRWARAAARVAASRPALAVILLNLAATIMVYVPLYEHQATGGIYLAFHGFSADNVYAYWDGPPYMVVAKSFYNLRDPVMTVFSKLEPGYYAAHFPAYPATIRAFSYVFGYPVGMLAATIAATSLALWVFYLLLKDLGLADKALWLGTLFLFIPPRWLIYHSVGASEPLFILAFLSFILFVRRRRYWLAGIAGAVAVLTRSPAVLFLVAYVGLTLWEYWKASPRPSLWGLFRSRLLPMAPFVIAPLLLFLFYQRQYGDFFAYFHSGDNIHLTGAPFASIWPSIIENNWAESNLWIYLLNAAGIFALWSRGYRDLAVFAGVFYAPLVFVAHHDLGRYMMPIFPLSLLIAFEGLVTRREFKLAMLLIIPAIYIYTWSGVQGNQAPQEEMQHLLSML